MTPSDGYIRSIPLFGSAFKTYAKNAENRSQSSSFTRGERGMSDFGKGKEIVARKEGRCEYCWARIPKGELYYRYKGIWSGDWQNWAMHLECIVDFHAQDHDEFCPGEAPMPSRIAALYELVAHQLQEKSNV